MNSETKLELLQKRAKEEIKLDQDLIILTMIASMLAVFGIKMGNIYVTIGSMLVSPLFDPIISSVIFILVKNKKEVLNSLRALVETVLISILLSGSFWFILYKFDFMQNIPELINSVNFFDVLSVAMLIGMVGTLLWIWPNNGNSSAGVAIAISLVPPIANMTLSAVTGNWLSATNYLYILLLNILGIFLGSIFILKIYVKGRYKNKL